MKMIKVLGANITFDKANSELNIAQSQPIYINADNILYFHTHLWNEKTLVPSATDVHLKDDKVVPIFEKLEDFAKRFEDASNNIE